MDNFYITLTILLLGTVHSFVDICKEGQCTVQYKNIILCEIERPQDMICINPPILPVFNLTLLRLEGLFDKRINMANLTQLKQVDFDPNLQFGCQNIVKNIQTVSLSNTDKCKPTTTTTTQQMPTVTTTTTTTTTQQMPTDATTTITTTTTQQMSTATTTTQQMPTTTTQQLPTTTTTQQMSTTISTTTTEQTKTPGTRSTLRHSTSASTQSFTEKINDFKEAVIALGTVVVIVCTVLAVIIYRCRVIYQLWYRQQHEQSLNTTELVELPAQEQESHIEDPSESPSEVPEPLSEDPTIDIPEILTQEQPRYNLRSCRI